jgi:hypothetical protein
VHLCSLADVHRTESDIKVCIMKLCVFRHVHVTLASHIFEGFSWASCFYYVIFATAMKELYNVNILYWYSCITLEIRIY